MSVASVAQLLQEQGGGSGYSSEYGIDGNYTDIVIGPSGTRVILECNTPNELLIENETTATIEWLDLNLPPDTDIGNYSTETETNDYIEANYTNNTDLNTNFVSNATIANYSTTIQTTNYLNANYTNSVDLANDYVANGGLTDYSTKTETNDYIDANYTNNTDLNTNIVSNATIANYSTTTETTNYLDANYTNSVDLANNYVANGGLTDYYTITDYNNTFLGLNNYLLSTNIFSYTFTANTQGLLNPNENSVFYDIPLTNWIGSANSSYVAYFQSCGQTPDKFFFTLTCRFDKVQGSNTLVLLYYKNITTAVIGSETCTISILAMN